MKNPRVEILANNTIEVYDMDGIGQEGIPTIRQDIHPDGRPWIDRAEARAWIDEKIAYWNNQE